jgi:serine/threonine kinase PknH
MCNHAARGERKVPLILLRQRATTENVGPVANNNGILSATVNTPVTASGSGAYINCLRALAVANNVAIDVQGCFVNQADYPSDAAVNIARQIAAKVPT